MGKKILITGAGSYIGTSFEKWMKQYGDDYKIETISTLHDEWKEKDFSGFDVVFHVAGIAHADAKRNMEDLYNKVNRDLTVSVAQKAKKDNVGQFIFMSSIIVYGEGNRENRVEYITRDTIPVPNNVYGMSKLQAEQGILALQTEAFKAAVLRPPMIYGKGCKGNYKKLAKLAKITPVFPDMGNRRSMLYIDNLCAFVKWVIDERKQGVCFPQNKEYVNTAQMVREIGRVYKREIRLIKCLNPFVKLFMNRVLLVNKVFGDLVYDKKLTDYGDSEYCVVDFTESIRETEGNTGSLLSRK